MEYRQLGRSGLRVPVLSLGTGTFGGGNEFFKAWGDTDAKGAAHLIDVCLDAGLTLFDTADIYSDGLAEEVLGAAVKGRRDKVLISTKATFRTGSGANDVGSSRFHLIRSVERALKRLGTDYIDLYQMHGFDAATPVEETLSGLDDLVKAGKVRYIGCSNFSGWHLMKSLAVSERYGWSRYVAHQAYYSLIGRDYEWELMPLGLDPVSYTHLSGAGYNARKGATMSSVPSTLRECHRLRVHLRDLQAEIDRGPRVLNGRQDDLEAARLEHQAHFDAITKLKLKQREDEGSLKQTDVRLAKLEEQLAGISVQKEYAAKEGEIAHTKTKKGELEDAILTAITELEERTAGIPAVEQKWAEAKAEFAQFQVEAAERLERMRADMETSRADLARAEATLPPEVKPTYDSIVRAKGPEGFAAAKARTCQGCRTSMTETQFTELRRGTFRTCTSCGRMQYPVE